MIGRRSFLFGKAAFSGAFADRLKEGKHHGKQIFTPPLLEPSSLHVPGPSHFLVSRPTLPGVETARVDFPGVEKSAKKKQHVFFIFFLQWNIGKMAEHGVFLHLKWQFQKSVPVEPVMYRLFFRNRGPH